MPPECRHIQGAIRIDFRLANGLFSNYEYSNRDGHMTNRIELADDIISVVAVLWVSLRSGAAL